ncbi:MAG TPA: PAS domain S-box protein, partial [Caulobacteraceae bacterium]|nr:PAS domain S-box protein [Caulobacteraceae bacterium]
DPCMVDAPFRPPPGWRASGNEMAELARAFDWAATPLGPREAWSPSLTLTFDLIQAAASPMSLRWGPDFVLIYNDGYRPILGDKHPWALGKPARVAWAEVWDQIAPMHTAILSGGTPAVFSEDVVLRIQRRGTEWDEAHLALGYSPIQDPTAPTGVGGLLVTAVEFTDRVDAEAALRETGAYLADLLRSSGEAFYAADRQGRATLCNRAFLAMLGFAREEDVIGRRLHDLIHHSHPDGAPYAETDCPIYRCTATGEPAHVDDEVFFRIGGESFPVEYWAYPVHRDGVLEGAICTFIDISERRAAQAALARSEAEFRTLAEAVPNLLWASRPDGQLNWFNSRVFAYTGLSPGEAPSWQSVLHPDDVGPATERWTAAVAIGETYETEFRLRRADGVYRWHLARALPIRNEAGQIVRWIGSNTDIEDQKIAAAALETLNLTLERQVLERTGELMAAEAALRQSHKMEAVGQLTGGIAHDFNNMLAVVIGSLDLLKRRLAGGDARAERYVEAASEGARRAALLTQRLLAFSRQQPLQPEPIDANRLVAGMSDLLRHALGAEVRLETVLAGGLWRTHADPNQLENVILNLGVNARDAMPDGGRLTIETQNAHLDERYVAGHLGVAAGQYVMIAVTDTGAGMSPEVIEQAFDPFFTTKETGKGTGLGLSQAYGFIKQSGGHVKIYSELGQGTTVKIYLPRLAGAAGGDQADGGQAGLVLGDRREVVLLVEDEAVVRQFSVDALVELGYQVIEADGAAAALRLLDAHPEIVLLFTDVVMPDVNGARLAEMARERRPDLKVLFTTGYTRNAVVHNGVLDSGVELIGKPFTLEALSAKLRAVLGEPRAV